MEGFVVLIVLSKGNGTVAGFPTADVWSSRSDIASCGHALVQGFCSSSFLLL